MGKKKRNAPAFRRRITNVHNTRQTVESALARQPDEIRLVVGTFDRVWQEAEREGLGPNEAMRRAIDTIISDGVSETAKGWLTEFSTFTSGPVERDAGDVPLRERNSAALMLLLNEMHHRGIPILPPTARQITEQLAPQINELRSSGIIGTPEQFDDAMKALADGGVLDAIARGR